MNFSDPLAVDSRLCLPCRVMLAPMHGVMSSAFAAAMDELDLVPCAITPFLSVSKNSVPSQGSLRRLLCAWPHTPERPRIVQLIGREAPELAETAYRLCMIGYEAVNLNFACPAPVVTGKGHGGACLKEPLLIRRILREIRRVCGERISLSVKLRTGWNSPSSIPELAEIVREGGASFAVVHFRTVNEMYSDVADPLVRLALFKQQVPDFPVFGNGDIHSPDDARTMCDETGCDGVAVARWILRDPYLLRRIQGRADTGPDAAKRFLCAICRHTLQNRKWPRNGFLECVKFCCGEESAEFKRISRMTDEEIQQNFR